MADAGDGWRRAGSEGGAERGFISPIHAWEKAGGPGSPWVHRVRARDYLVPGKLMAHSDVWA